MNDYPEHEKLKAVAEQSEAIGEFIEASGYTLCKPNNGGRFVATAKSITEILAEFFDIDLKKIEVEKRAMYDAISAAAEAETRLADAQRGFDAAVSQLDGG